MSKLIIEEPPLQVLPSLALAIGLNEAIVLQQLHYLLRDPRFGKRIEEHQWIFNTVEQWRCSYFPFWSTRTIKAVFASLKSRGLVATCQPEGRISRRQYYRINTEQLAKLADGAKSAPSMGQYLHDGKGQYLPLPTTKTTSETSSKNTKGAFGKAPKLFFPRIPYPTTEDEMIATLEVHGIEHNPDYDGDFFAVMTRNDWKIRRKPVWDWIETYRARLTVTSPNGS